MLGCSCGPSNLPYVTRSLRHWDSKHLVGNIRVPTLLINGSADLAQDPLMRPFFDHIEKVKWVTIDNAAHYSHVDQREKYVQHLRAFVDT